MFIVLKNIQIGSYSELLKIRISSVGLNSMTPKLEALIAVSIKIGISGPNFDPYSPCSKFCLVDLFTEVALPFSLAHTQNCAQDCLLFLKKKFFSKRLLL